MNDHVIQDYYCYVDNAEIVGEEIHFLFDGVTKEWYAEYLNDNFIADEMFEKIIPQVIFAKTTLKQLLAFNQNHTIHDFQDIWVHLQLTNRKTPFPAELYVENNDENPEPILMYVYSVAPLKISNPVADKVIQKRFTLNNIKDATTTELETALTHSGFGQPDNFVAIFNVGQGNLNALCTSEGNPLLYFDLGGGCYQNRKTYTKTLRLCFSDLDTIILSHWDADHLTTAKRYYGTPDWNKFNGKTWIAPRQSLGASNLKFAYRVNSISSLLLWPITLQNISFDDGKVYLCNGSDKNHSGLALMTDLTKGKHNICKVLLPADAAYKYIPLPKGIITEAVVASHHGAEFDDLNHPIPYATNPSAIGYSYGYANTYRHPRNKSTLAHHRSGWINRLDTVNGHIAFTNHSVPRISPCGCAHCDLSIQQSY